jgi:hypothetical protein
MAQTDLFSGIQDWVGTGVNEAALVIDWNNGTADDSLIWGYRWNGSATGEQMLDAIVAADPRLYAEISVPGEYGTQVFGFGFHPSGDQNFQLSASSTPALSFNSDHLAYTAYDGSGVDYTRTAVTPGDFWQEGDYDTGYGTGAPTDGGWSYFNSTDSRLTANPSDWDYASTGITDRVLDNDDVDGWVFSYNDGAGDAVPAAPIDVAPVPEPSTWAILFGGGISLACLRRNHRAQKTA